ncbi:MAG: DMT family transporter [Burkholderiaceae bacterium]
MQSLWMVAAALCFAVMGALVKYATASVSPFEVVFYRGVICTILIGLWIRARGLSFGTERTMMHVRRSVIGTVAMSFWFYAVGKLPLSTGMTLNYTAPVFIALLLAVMAWRQQRRHGVDPSAVPGAASRHRLYLAIAGGFAGVLITLRPSVDAGQTMAMSLGLASGLLSAFALLQIRALGRIGEPEWRTVFYFSVVNALYGLLGAAIDGFHPLDGGTVATLVGLSLLALAGQLLMTRAFSRGRALLTANLQYTGIVFATIVGWIFFDERADTLELVGMAMVIASGAMATWLSSKDAALQAAAQSTNGASAARPATMAEPPPADRHVPDGDSIPPADRRLPDDGSIPPADRRLPDNDSIS